MNNFYLDQLKQIESRLGEAERMLDDPEMVLFAQQEIDQLKKEKGEIEAAIDQANWQTTRPSKDQEPANCIIEFRSGAGGEEAKIWATELLRMYLRFAEQTKFKIEMIDDQIIKIIGKTSAIPHPNPEKSFFTAYELFKFESGVHRVQRVPVTESQGRIHTSTASVAVLPEVHSTAVEIKDEDLEWQFMRSSGAGGQSVNKTSSACRLIHHPTGITVTARQEKKQEQNRAIALELLRAQLWEIEEEKRLSTIGEARSVIGRAQRAEKIRTYNFPQNRVTDHRTKQSWHNLELILSGSLTELLSELHAELGKELSVNPQTEA